MAKFNSGMFDYDPATKSFSVDMSQLDHGTLDHGQVFHQVYQDACDEGLTMVSDRTGRYVDFVVVKVDGGDEEHDGEIQGWRLAPTEESIRKNPNVRGMSLLIVNT